MNQPSKQSLVIESLGQIVGKENVLTRDSNKFTEYLADMAGYESNPLVVVLPGSCEDVSRIVSLARKTKTAVIARGAGTSLTGAISTSGGIMIDFSKRMNHVMRIDSANWYVECEPGVVLDDLNEELKKHGFFFPPDPGSAAWCTVGGAIAENSGGMRCFRYGTVKDWVLSLEAVLADGSIVRLGEPLPKNRVGYDFVHLICGSEGTLAIVTKAWLKITPFLAGAEKPRRLYVFFNDWSKAGSAIQAIRANRIVPNLLEFMDDKVVKAVNKSFDLKIPEYGATLFVETEGHVEELLKLCEENGSVSSYLAIDEDDEERLYNARALALLGVKDLGYAVMSEDVVVPVDRLAEYLEFIIEVSKRYALTIPTCGHAGDGNIHPMILYNQELREKSETAFKELCEKAISIGGTISGEHGIGKQKLALAAKQLSTRNGNQVMELMKKIKKEWDPENILNPGKFMDFDLAQS